MKIIFFGSDDFALINLEALVRSEHQVVACVTQPDKAKGRGLKVSFSPIKECALKNQLPIFQPLQLKDQSFIEQLKSYQSDLFVVVAYGKILPIEVLSVPYLCCMNVHGSLLPKYRGAAPINWALINAEEETGISIIKMNTAMDGGDLFAQAKIRIGPDENAGSLRRKMADLGADLLLKTINSLEKNAYTLAAQDSSKVTFAPKLTKGLGWIDWSKDARVIHNLVRGLSPKPGAYTFYEGKQLKILETTVTSIATPQKQKGGIIALQKEGFVVVTDDYGLLVRQVHLESAQVMDAESFISGHQLAVGFQFEEGKK